MLAAHIPTCGHRIHRAAFIAERVFADAAAATAAFILRPGGDPTAPPERRGVTAHFLAPEATMTLALARHGATLVAEATGRDEVANTGAGAGSPLAARVNGLVAEVASGLAGLPMPATLWGGGPQAWHWEAFVRGMLA